jgi:hypothetical protein
MKPLQSQNEITSPSVREAINKIFDMEDAQKALTALANAPDSIHHERVHFAILKYALHPDTTMGLVNRFLTALGSARPSVIDRFRQGVKIASEDWRDILVKTGLEGENWRQVLLSDGLVGPKWLESLYSDHHTDSSQASSTFRMSVDDVHTIRGRGISVTGQVESGILNIQDEIHILGKDTPQKLVVADILLGREQVNQASMGAKIEIQLLDIEKDCIKRGDKLTG